MSTLVVWAKDANSATPEYWNFRNYCESKYNYLYGKSTQDGSAQSFRDIMQDQLYQWGGRLTLHHECIEFVSEKHQLLWQLRWSSP